MDYTLTHNPHTSMATLSWKYPRLAYPITLSLQKLLPGCTIDSTYTTIHFRATTVTYLSTHSFPLCHNQLQRALFSLSTQLHHLQDQSIPYSFVTFNPQNILVLDESVYLYLTLDHLCIINTNTNTNNPTMTVTFPPLQTPPQAPETTTITTLPYVLPVESSFFHLASCILWMGLSPQERGKNIQDMWQDHPLQYTKLHQSLRRATRLNPAERLLLYI